jgi:hypothetical protein
MKPSLYIERVEYSGPTVVPMRPGRLSGGAQLEIMITTPLMIPAAPRPATTRPTISIFEETAAPQSTEPDSKTPKNVKKVHLTGKSV